MRILAIDVGTGTQDILLFDTSTEVENCLQLVMPSPTVLIANRIKAATAKGRAVLLKGTIMGGGPSAWAATDHIRTGLPVYATPDAARSFDDDLTRVQATGMQIVGEGQASGLDAEEITMKDVDLAAIEQAFVSFGVELAYDALAVAVFDHGNAPPDNSDRRFRFEFLAERLVSTRRLSSLAFMAEDIPVRLTRMKAVAESVSVDVPFMLMDTAAAAVLGALEDARVRTEPNAIIANLGNFHTVAFRFADGLMTGLFEHHTGELSAGQLEAFLVRLADGTLTNDAIFESQGHGAILFDRRPMPLDFLAVTGPRRSLLLNSRLNPYFAVPYGDMMLAGDFGLVRAYADLNADARDEIESALTASRQIA